MDSGSDQSCEEEWLERLQKIKANDPHMKKLVALSEDDVTNLQNMTDEAWEELGRDISNNTHLTEVELGGDINDQMMSCLFQGLTGSSSVIEMHLYENGLSIGVRSMLTFLQNADNLTRLDLDDNTIQSSGFNELLWALRNSPIETLCVNRCSIEAIEIHSEHMPQNLKALHLFGNNINSDCCRELAKLLKGGNATLQSLLLGDSKINDDGVEILVDALKKNTTLKTLYLNGNDDISERGLMMILGLVNDVSSIEATLQSNHTLQCIFEGAIIAKYIQSHIYDAVRINKEFQDDPDRVGKERIIQTQLNSEIRASLANIQGVSHSLYSEIDPLQLPEVLTLVGSRHGQGELYVALKASIAGVISTVNRRECMKQRRDYHLAEAKQLDAELAAMDELEREVAAIESHRSKRRRQ